MVGSEPLVLRIGGLLDDYELDPVASDWARPALPIPPVLDLGQVLDRWFVLTRRVFGTPLDSLDEPGWLAGMSPLMEALVALQGVDPCRVGAGALAGLNGGSQGSWREWLVESAEDPVDRRLGRWRDAMYHQDGAVVSYDAADEVLRRVVGECPELRQVVHTDLSGNTLMADGEIRRAAAEDLVDAGHGRRSRREIGGRR